MPPSVPPPAEATSPPATLPTEATAPSPPNTPQILFLGSEYCSEANKCGLCEGDCDSDDDCEEDLICYQRDADEDIPGCEGVDSSSKYTSRRDSFLHTAVHYYLLTLGWLVIRCFTVSDYCINP